MVPDVLPFMKRENMRKDRHSPISNGKPAGSIPEPARRERRQLKSRMMNFGCVVA